MMTFAKSTQLLRIDNYGLYFNPERKRAYEIWRMFGDDPGARVETFADEARARAYLSFLTNPIE